MDIERNRKLSKIQVVIRKRPLNAKEIKNGQSDIVEVQSQDTLVIKEQKVKVDMTKYIEENYFNFD
jgi:kinesin family protein 2/24